MSKHVPPPTGTPIAGPERTQDSLIARLARQARKRERALARLRELRKRASDEIDRLLDFLDSSDIDPDLEPTLGFMNGPAEQDECEEPEDGEPSLASLDRMTDQTRWAEGGMMDAELDKSDDEPSLGSGAALSCHSQSQWSQPGGASDDREHDPAEGPEEVNEDGDGNPDDEPSLGWTVDGVIQNTSAAECDAELQDHLTARPQNRTEIEGPQISAESGYRKFLVGLSDEQKQKFRERMLEQEGTTGVLVR